MEPSQTTDSIPPAPVAPSANQTPGPSVTAAPIQQPANVSTVAPAPATGSTALHDMKYIRRSGIVAVIVGILLTAIGAYVGFFINKVSITYVPLGIITLVFGIKLLNKQAGLKSIIISLRVLTGVLLVLLLLAIVSGLAPGALILLMAYFVFKATMELHRAGLTTSPAIFKAKPTAQ